MFFADITEANENKNFAIKNRHPYIIHSKYTENGKDYNFISHNIWFEPSGVGIIKIRVFVDKNDYSKYYVDENSLKEGL